MSSRQRRHINALGVTLLRAIVLPLFGAGTLQAATLQVTTVDDTLAGPNCSLRAAILAANTDAPVGGCPQGDPGLDSIILPAGVFTLDLADAAPPATCGPDGDQPCAPADEDLGETGDLDVASPIEIVGAGQAATMVQSAAGLGGDPARVLEIHNGGTATLRDLTIRNGRTLPGEPGAGIAVGTGASLMLTDCVVAENQTDGSGGGVYAGPRSSVTVERCELRDNLGFGGGLSGLSANVTLRNSLVAGNRATTSGGGGGLALVAGQATIEHTEITDNIADDSRWGGGGILLLAGRVTVRASTLAGNTATDALNDGSVPDPELDETGGGGLAAFSAEVWLENSTISGNRAVDSRWGGGGVLALFSDIRIVHTTFHDNQAHFAFVPGGSLSALGSGDALASFTVARSILDAASPAECGALFSPLDPAPDGTENLVADASCGTSMDSSGPVTGLDPVLGDAGGPTRTHRLLAGSNAIDATPVPCAVALDQRGIPRPQGTACDLGAVERQAGSVTLTIAGAGDGTGTMTDDVPGGTLTCTSTAGITSGDCNEQADIGAAFAVIAAPEPGSQFGGWTGCDSTSTSNLPDDTCHLTLVADTTLIAVFGLATGLGSATSLSSDNNPSLIGENVTFTATVTPSSPVPTGTVIFTIDDAPQAPVALDGAGQASLTTASLAAGNHSVTAAYGGDDTYDASTSETLEQVVQGAVNIAATKTVQGNFVPGGSITYTVVLSNTGTVAQPDNPGDEFVDVLPSALILVSAASTSGTTVADPGVNTVTFNGAIAVGASVTITIDATIIGQQGSIANQGAAWFDVDGDGTNESEVLTDDPTTPEPGDATVFQVGIQAVRVPALSTIALMLLAVMLAVTAMRRTPD